MFALACLLCLSAGPGRCQDAAISLEDAVRHTLEHNIGIKVEKEVVRQKEGLLQTATGQFDLVAIAGSSVGTTRLPLSTAQRLSRYASYRLWQDTYREDTDSYYMGLTQQLRSGVTFSPLVSARSLQNNYDQYDLVNYSEASLTIAMPLLKGLGEKATGADEMAARSSLKAERLLAKHVVSRAVLDSANAFWGLLAAQDLLDTALKARSRADDFYRLLERLIKGGELPPNLSTQALAKLLARDADLASSQLSVYQGQQTLGLTMGYTPEQLAATPKVRGSFPAVAPAEAFQGLDRQSLVQKALQARLDYQSLQNDLEAASIIVEKAANFTKPNLKLSLKGGYAGLAETSAADRYYSSLTDELRGVNFQTSLVLELPIQNNAARGEYLRQRALEAQTRLRLMEMSNAIASEVLVALEAAERAEQEYRLAGLSAEKYRQAVDVATSRFKQGEGSINDVLDLEDKYATALGNQTNALYKYSASLAKLRYATGTLLTEKDGDLVFNPGSLAKLPFAEANGGGAWRR